MSHTNYNNVSAKTKDNNAPVTPVAPATPVTVTADATAAQNVIVPETPAQPEVVFGTVYDCKKLNIRKSPNANAQVLFTIPKDTKVKIDLNESTVEWYKVTVNNKVGFCMKKYISLPQ